MEIFNNFEILHKLFSITISKKILNSKEDKNNIFVFFFQNISRTGKDFKNLLKGFEKLYSFLHLILIKLVKNEQNYQSKNRNRSSFLIF